MNKKLNKIILAVAISASLFVNVIADDQADKINAILASGEIDELTMALFYVDMYGERLSTMCNNKFLLNKRLTDIAGTHKRIKGMIKRRVC